MRVALMAPTIPERITRVETQLEQQNEQIKELRQQVSKLETRIDEIKDILTQARGGWKVFIWVGTAVGMIVSGLSWIAGKVMPILWTLPR